nr:uncharacterized protein LOC112294114 isoform X1 [Physcomitrium patens]|eukprot:XP_024400056.1 uncharacterized protein LOC112294114 isoform X1 [Physcomitrella patens]
MAASRGIGIGTMNESHSTAVWLCDRQETRLADPTTSRYNDWNPESSVLSVFESCMDKCIFRHETNAERSTVRLAKNYFATNILLRQTLSRKRQAASEIAGDPLGGPHRLYSLHKPNDCNSDSLHYSSKGRQRVRVCMLRCFSYPLPQLSRRRNMGVPTPKDSSEKWTTVEPACCTEVEILPTGMKQLYRHYWKLQVRY